jgi:hypothetical protein
MRMGLSAVAMVLLLAACSNGPKGNAGSTVESYFDAANDQDYEAMTSCLAPDSIKRIGNASRMASYLKTSFVGWQDFEIDVKDVRINADGKTGVVQFDCHAQVFNERTRKLMPGTCSDLFSVVKDDADGKWRIVLPESQRIKPML